MLHITILLDSITLSRVAITRHQRYSTYREGVAHVASTEVQHGLRDDVVGDVDNNINGGQVAQRILCRVCTGNALIEEKEQKGGRGERGEGRGSE